MLPTKKTCAPRERSVSAGCHSGSQPGSDVSCEVVQCSKSCTACHRNVGVSLTTIPSRSMLGSERMRRYSATVSEPTMPLTWTDAYRAAARGKYTADPPSTSRLPAGVVMSSLCSVPATATSQVTRELGSARRRGAVPAAEERDDRGEPRTARFERAHEEHLLGLEQDIGHVVGVAVDPEAVAQPRVHRAHGANHRAPE